MYVNVMMSVSNFPFPFMNKTVLASHSLKSLQFTLLWVQILISFTDCYGNAYTQFYKIS